MYMETKGIEEMTREELIELVSSLNKDLESTKKDLELYKDWKNRCLLYTSDAADE